MRMISIPTSFVKGKYIILEDILQFYNFSYVWRLSGHPVLYVYFIIMQAVTVLFFNLLKAFLWLI